MSRCRKKYIEDLIRNDNVHGEDFKGTLLNNCNEDEIVLRFEDPSNADDDQQREKIEENNQIALDDLETDYDEVEKHIFEAEDDEPIYRGLEIKDYRSFINGLSHVGFTLDKWLGKEPKIHENAGRYWTWDEGCARKMGECDSPLFDKSVILKARVKPENIDKRCTHDNNFTFGNREREICLKRGHYIEIDEICRHVEDKKGKMKPVCESYGKKVKI